ELDAGVVYASDVIREGADELGWITVPRSLGPAIAYTIAITRDADDAALARRFVDDLLSPDGQAVLRRYHFLPAEPSATGGGE
ncbi:MAG TPA: substrate-binding domain-containing protein, partial [Limnochordia bacterium]